ncbi:MAG: HAMP domain-containing sensor histidine kinase [Flavobacteriaceae bacterium]|nr:HAMP domain-containing sensor histidine kinase [Flavobacteriaceae bacterium]
MTGILVISGFLVVLITAYQYEAQREKYHFDRLNRKESQIIRHIDYIVNKYDLVDAGLGQWKNLESDFNQINQIHSVKYSLFTMDGQRIFSFFAPLEVLANDYSLKAELIDQLKQAPDNRILETNIEEVHGYSSSFRILTNQFNTPYAILFYPYFSDVDIAENELNLFLQTFYQIYIILLIGTIIFAYFLARYVTRSIESVRNKLNQTDLQGQNEKLEIINAPIEILGLIEAYNKMIDQLIDSANQLVKQEKDYAWREMARQIAHEVKNALTPMRLIVQDFNEQFDPHKQQSKKKLSEFSLTLIEQINSMSELAESFSYFTTEPKKNVSESDLVNHTKLVAISFTNFDVRIKSSHEKIIYTLDVNQWTRVLNNLILNAQQAIPDKREGYVEIKFQLLEDKIVVEISDNGCGINPELRNTIFEPKFTSKNSGTGLGLGIVRNIILSHGGTISYDSEIDVGTTFRIVFPLI